MPDAPPRPVGVTVLIVLLWIEAVFAIAGGLVLILENDDQELLRHVTESSDTLLGLGIGLVIVGFITAVVAAALGRGSAFARVFAAIIAVLHLIGSFFSFFALDGVTRGNAFFSALVAIVILYILYGEKGSQEFFEADRRGTAAR